MALLTPLPVAALVDSAITPAGEVGFNVRFADGSFWLNEVADEIAARSANATGQAASRAIIQQTCRLQRDQQLEDDRSAAVFTALRRGGVEAEHIRVLGCDLMQMPVLDPGVLRVTLIWEEGEAPINLPANLAELLEGEWRQTWPATTPCSAPWTIDLRDPFVTFTPPGGPAIQQRLSGVQSGWLRTINSHQVVWFFKHEGTRSLVMRRDDLLIPGMEIALERMRLLELHAWH